jgi:hypothetical protein
MNKQYTFQSILLERRSFASRLRSLYLEEDSFFWIAATLAALAVLTLTIYSAALSAFGF